MRFLILLFTDYLGSLMGVFLLCFCFCFDFCFFFAFFCFVLLKFFFLLLIKQLFFSHEMAKVSKRLCLSVYLFICLVARAEIIV